MFARARLCASWITVVACPTAVLMLASAACCSAVMFCPADVTVVATKALSAVVAVFRASVTCTGRGFQGVKYRYIWFYISLHPGTLILG